MGGGRSGGLRTSPGALVASLAGTAKPERGPRGSCSPAGMAGMSAVRSPFLTESWARWPRSCGRASSSSLGGEGAVNKARQNFYTLPE